MKSTLTIGQKISLGFAAVLIVTALVGAIAITSMRTVSASARTLAKEFVPEVDVVSDLGRDVGKAQLAIRSYGLTAEASYLEEARSAMERVHQRLKAAVELANAHPQLVKLRAQAAELEQAVTSFEAAINETEAHNRQMADHRRKLDELAANFTTDADALIEGQRSRLDDEIKNGLDSAVLQERARKLAYAQEARALANSARLSTFKAQALRDATLFDTALQTFGAVESKLGELRRMLKVKADLDELGRMQADAQAYRDIVQAVAADTKELNAIAKKRRDIADRLFTITDELATAGIKRTVEAADSSDQRLATSTQLIFVGGTATLGIGIVIAFLISRGTSKALTVVADGLNEASTQVSAAAGQVAAASQTLAEGSSEQAASLEETSASLEEMASMTKRNAESAQQAKHLSTLTRTSADAGAEHMQQMREAMDAIKASSDEIAKIIKSIDEIAFQTNILALNAAVEAARAGEAGAGFAVVAEEVRSLAHRSAQSAKETAGKIQDAISKSEHGVAISAKVATTLTDILEKARQMDALIGEIATASGEQNQGIGQVNQAASQMDKVTQSNASTAEESAAAAEELNAQALTMQQAVTDLRRLVAKEQRRTASAQSAPTEAAPPRAAARSAVQPAKRTLRPARAKGVAEQPVSPDARALVTAEPEAAFFGN